MWRPGFSYAEKLPALLTGYHRAFCRISLNHRGTPEQPGMVVGLSPGGNCRGIAYRLEPAETPEVLAYLDDREGAGYRRCALPLDVGPPGQSRQVQSWAYLPDPEHPTHQPGLPRERMVELIATGHGASGAAVDYLRELVQGLEALNAGEPALHEMLAAVEQYREALPAAGGG
jgi:cation transport protein ChaC